MRLCGPGSAGTASTLANCAAWQALMATNEALFAASTANATTTALDFQGVGGASSTVAVTGLNTALQLLSGWVQEKPPIAAGAVAAYEAAVAAMIPAEVALANRAEQAADVAMNPLVLGALTPAIVALDTVYFGEFWPQNAASGALYGVTLAALTAALAVPPPLSPPGAAATAPATAAAAVAQAVGQAVAGEAMDESAHAAADGAVAPARAAAEGGQMASALGQTLQAAVGALQPAMGMFQMPAQAAQALSAVPQSMMSGLTGTFDDEGVGEGEVTTALLGAPSGAVGSGLTAGAGAAGGGVGGVGPGGVPGAGLTTYSRPPASFPTENSGRPAGLKSGLLSAADARALGPGGLGGTAIPAGPAGVSGQAKGFAEKGAERGGSAYARIALMAGQPPKDRRS
ncbi:MAG: PPE domain-containing protein [Mycobacterium sp.]|nr:PPE domain-containing protein [Mycobacterium sp.]